jgi:hypothetical protein
MEEPLMMENEDTCKAGAAVASRSVHVIENISSVWPNMRMSPRTSLLAIQEDVSN